MFKNYHSTLCVMFVTLWLSLAWVEISFHIVVSHLAQLWQINWQFPKTICQIQASLVIRGFVICGFGYPWPANCVLNSVSADISLNYLRILILFNGKDGITRPNQWSLVIHGFGNRGIFLGRNPRE